MKELPHTDFVAAFADETRFRCSQRGILSVKSVDVGDLVLPSGNIVTCDPGNIGWNDSSSLMPRVPCQKPGRYPVRVSVVREDDHPECHPRVACAMVRFCDDRPVSWEMARTANQMDLKLPRGSHFGYGVDVGAGCFVDAATLSAIGAVDPSQFYEEKIMPDLLTSDWSCVMLDSATGGNVVMFSSGYGDGSYCSYWGRSKEGKICCLATDFWLLVEHLEGSTTVRLGKLIDDTANLGELSEIGVTRVEVEPRPDVRIDPKIKYGCVMRIHGAICEVKIHNKNNEYRSQGYSWSQDIATYNFRFDEELDLNAKVRFEYSLGVRALPAIRSKEFEVGKRAH